LVVLDTFELLWAPRWSWPWAWPAG